MASGGKYRVLVEYLVSPTKDTALPSAQADLSQSLGAFPFQGLSSAQMRWWINLGLTSHT